ncbi:kinase-like domain-containing protein [Xylaria bambusicola]|nr:kinase-like domain-containing protein [Xylaria bambusicola]KAI0506683.1 kinase-like domain-containing protein [Xylaria bambusicola]
MASTIVGDSGRVYVKSDVLQRNRENDNLSIFKAEYVLNSVSENQSFAVKRVSRPFYNMSVRLATEFAGSRVLIYPYYTTTLLSLIQDKPDFSPTQRYKILRYTAEAIAELHNKNWIHIDIKPDNILVNLTCDNVTNVALGDFDIACKLEDGHVFQTPHAIGNAMWRSPEGQTGTGVSKASDMFSFGLVCIFTLGGGPFLLIENYEELVKHNIRPEQEILTRHFSMFGPVPEGLLKQVTNENWRRALEIGARAGEEVVKQNPLIRFSAWGVDLGPEAYDMISGVTNLDPAARTKIDRVLSHRVWQEEVDESI